jgi:predicted PurR-regulated permease PerM
MNDKEKVKQIRNLMLMAAVLILVIIYSREIVSAVLFLFGILKPFIYGAILAFVLNIPMRAIEEKLLKSWDGKRLTKLKRPLSILMSILIIVLVVGVIVGMVIPQLAESFSEIGNKLPELADKLRIQIPDFNWDDIVAEVTNFLENGASDIVSSTFSMVGSIISAVVNFIISVVFAVYILAQKEKLSNQVGRIVSAYFSERVVNQLHRIYILLYTNFKNFITGQCLEAVILGSLFVIFMSILRLPYAFLIGMLISLTALIPIAGAFIGCAIGAFLIFLEAPKQVIVFLVLFIVLQQIEGKLIYPRVVGNFVGLPGIWVLFAITVGGSLFGIIGMLMFIPLTATAYTLIRENVNKRNAVKEATKGGA